MALIVEDGSNVANANSYAELAYIKAYAQLRGITLAADAVIENQVALAMDYLESKRNNYQGLKTYPDQSLQFPRNYLVIDSNEFPNNAIPKELKNALSQLVIEIENGISILPTINEAPIKRETVGPITTEYAVNPGTGLEPIIFSVEALLQPLFKNSTSSGFGVKFMRV